jgi:uncharacterized protein YciI
MKGGDKTQATTVADLSLKTYGYPEGANSDASAAQAITLARTQKQQTMNNTFSTGGTRKKTKKSHRSTKKHNLSNYYVLTYKFKNGISSKRKLIREKHLLFSKQFEENNSLLMGGPLSLLDDLFIFNNKKSAEKFKHKDPYILNKLVSKASIKPWNVTVGVLKSSYHLSNLFNQLGGGISSNTTTAVQFNTSSISPNANANSTALSNQSTALQNSANAKYDACVGQPPSCGN